MQANKYLKEKIDELNNFLKNNTRPPQDLFESFMVELEVSKLFIATTIENEEMDFEHYESEDGLDILPIFTEESQYKGDCTLYSFRFSFYKEVVEECDFDGIIINPDDEAFFVTREMLNYVHEVPNIDGEPLDVEKLKELAFTVQNEELVDFITDESKFNKYDELVELLSRATLLNVASSKSDLSGHAKDGIIFALDVGGFGLSVKTEGDSKYALFFTSLDAIKKTCDVNAGVYYYCQITSLDKILNFILSNGLDGIIINPYLEDYYVPRKVLLDLYANHPDIVYNPKYLEGTYFAFIF